MATGTAVGATLVCCIVGAGILTTNGFACKQREPHTLVRGKARGNPVLKAAGKDK